MPSPKFKRFGQEPKSYKQMLKEEAKKNPLYKSYVTKSGKLAPEPLVTEERKLDRMKYIYGNPMKKPINT